MDHASPSKPTSRFRSSEVVGVSSEPDGGIGRGPAWTLAVAALAMVIFAIDLTLPLGVACGVLYVVPAALTLWLGDFRTSATTAVGCAALTVAGYFLSSSSAEPTWMILLNRGYALLALGLITALAGLRTRLDDTNRKLRNHSRSMRHLLEIGRRLLTSFELTAIQRTTVRSARDLFDADGAGLAFFDPETETWHWELLTDDMTAERLDVDDAASGCIGRSVVDGETRRFERRGSTASAERPVLARARLQSGLAVPVERPAEITGVLMIGYRRDQSFTNHDELLLDAFANLVALAVHISRLYDRVGAVSAQRERHRIANEVHDGFAQTFGYMLMRLGTVQRLLDRGKHEEVEQAIAGLETLIEDAGDDVRTFIRQLRDGERGEPSLLRSPRRVVERAARRAEVDIELTSRTDELPELPAPIEIQAARVLDECFRNVRQHARQPAARVDLGTAGDCVVIEIENDGGTNELPEHRHFGLEIMRERTQSIGGDFDFQSGDRSTTVRLQLPVDGGTQS